MRILTLDAALAGCSAGLVDGGTVIAERAGADAQALAALAGEVLREAGPGVDRVAVTVGPGSFTGLRTALAVAHGIALARGIGLHGVSVGEAMAAEAPGDREFWAAVDSKRGRVFLERDGRVEAFALESLPTPDRQIAVAGDAAESVVARLAARGADVQLLPATRPAPRGIALASMRGPARAGLPLYVDPPEARPGPAGRPAPR